MPRDKMDTSRKKYFKSVKKRSKSKMKHPKLKRTRTKSKCKKKTRKKMNSKHSQTKNKKRRSASYTSKRARKRSKSKNNRVPNTKRAKTPGAAKRGKCSSKNGRFPADDTNKEWETNNGCPKYAFRTGNCCRVDVKSFKDAVKMNSHVSELTREINNDPNLNATKKTELVLYIKQRTDSLGEMVENIGIATEVERNFILDVIKNTVDRLTRYFTTILAPVWNTVKKHFSRVLDYLDKKTQSMQKIYKSNKKLSGTVTGAVGGAALSFGFGLGWAGTALATAVGGAVGFVGLLKIMRYIFEKIMNNTWPLVEGISKLVKTFLKDPQVIYEYSIWILSLKRFICAELGVLLKNKVLYEMYIAKGGLGPVSRAMQAAGTAKYKSFTVEKAFSSIGTLTADSVKTVASSVGAAVGYTAGNMSSGLQLASKFGGTAASVINAGMFATLYKGTLTGTYNNIMMLFSFDDCENAYNEQRSYMYQEILSKDLYELVQKGIEKKYIRVEGLIESSANFFLKPGESLRYMLQNKKEAAVALGGTAATTGAVYNIWVAVASVAEATGMAAAGTWISTNALAGLGTVSTAMGKGVIATAIKATATKIASFFGVLFSLKGVLLVTTIAAFFSLAYFSKLYKQTADELEIKLSPSILLSEEKSKNEADSIFEGIRKENIISFIKEKVDKMRPEFENKHALWAWNTEHNDKQIAEGAKAFKKKVYKQYARGAFSVMLLKRVIVSVKLKAKANKLRMRAQQIQVSTEPGAGEPLKQETTTNEDPRPNVNEETSKLNMQEEEPKLGDLEAEALKAEKQSKRLYDSLQHLKDTLVILDFYDERLDKPEGILRTLSLADGFWSSIGYDEPEAPDKPFFKETKLPDSTSIAREYLESKMGDEPVPASLIKKIAEDVDAGEVTIEQMRAEDKKEAEEKNKSWAESLASSILGPIISSATSAILDE